jgi:biopolymer transport protein ExbB
MSFVTVLTAAAGAAPAGDNPYGLLQALNEGGVISWTVFVILVAMSVFSFYILFTKLFEQQKIISQGRKVRSSFWNSPNLREAASKLEARSAYRAIVDDALVAQEQHDKLTDPIDRHDWMGNSLARSQGAIGARLGKALPSSRPSARPLRSSVCSVPSSASTAPSSRSVHPVRLRSTSSPVRSVRR